MLLPAIVWAAYLLLRVGEVDPDDLDAFDLYVCTFGTVFFVLANLVSLIHIKMHNIDYVKTYIWGLIIDIPLVCGAVIAFYVMLEIRDHYVSSIMGILYPVVCTILTAITVCASLKKQKESQVDNPKLSHVLALTYINPLLLLLPFLMAIAIVIAHFGEGFGIL